MSDIDYISSKTSYLLKKDEIGKPKPSIRKLPEENFAYGKSSGVDKDGARECKINSDYFITTIIVLSSWQFHAPSSEAELNKDFKRLNKLGVKEGYSTSKVKIILKK